MAQKYINKALGLHTFKNELTVPDGALTSADNVIIDRDNIIESRRGFNLFKDFGISSDRSKQILQYKDKLLVHYENKLLFQDSSDELQEFDGTYEELESNLRIKGKESNGNFYFTTTDGVKKISALTSDDFTSDPGYIFESGAVRGLDINGVCDYDVGIGFLAANSNVAYRMVWGYKDNNSNLVLGYPSEIGVVRNVDSTNSCNVNLEITIPSNITSDNPLNYFYQIYRSNQRTGDVYDIEFQLVIEDFPSDTDFSNGYVSVNDFISDNLKDSGATLYTNEISGGGIASGNEQPPLCRDLEYFKGSMFYSNTSTRHSYSLSISSLVNIDNNTKLIIANEDQVTEYTFQGVKQVTDIDGTAFAANNNKPSDLDQTYFFLNSANNNRQYFVWWDYLGNPEPVHSELAGKIGVRIDITHVPDAAGETESIGQALVDTLNNLNNGIDFSAGYAGDIVQVTNKNNGPSVDAEEVTNSPMPNVDITTSTPGLGEDADNKKILLSDDESVGYAIEETTASIVKVINKNANELVNAYTLTDEYSVSGEIQFSTKSAQNKKIFFAVNKEDIADNFTPTLPVLETGLSISTDSSESKATVTKTNHGMKVGEYVVIYNSTSTNLNPNGSYIITEVTTNTFTVTMSSSIDTIANVDAFYGGQYSDNERKPNRVYYSKDGIPEAVPGLNYFDVGAKDSPILRVVALRDSLFILKTEGIYRLSGTDEANFSVTLFDSSSPLIAADSPAVLNNQIYMLSTQGVISITDSGVSLISRNIESDILKPTSNNYSNFSTQCFGISSESDRSYYLFLPTDITDNYATQCFRYNVFTKAWTRWVMSKTCGIVKTDDDKIYFGSSDVNYIEQERKNFLRSDYSDRQYDNLLTLMKDSYTIELGQIQSVSQFDVVYQEQYITISRFNRLLSRLDSDILLCPEVSDRVFVSNYTATNGADLATLLSGVISTIDSKDTTTSYSNSSGDNTNTSIRDDFNTLMDELNASDGIFQSNFRIYSDLVKYETIISELNKYINEVTTLTPTPFVIGDIIIYKAIQCFVEYAPETLGDASLMKHFRESTLMFDQFNFSFGEMGFRSDQSDNYETQLFVGEGNGDYGSQVYGDYIYGGNANQRPFRTYVPRNKQRCRMVILSFTHTAARENFSLNGYSVTYNEQTTPRAYKR